MQIKITGSGSYIPTLRVTNQDFANHEFLNDDGSSNVYDGERNFEGLTSYFS